MTNNSKAKIVHIITGLGIGGAERALHTLLSNGLQGEFSNHVISLVDEGHYGPLLRRAGIPITVVKMRRSFPDPVAIFRLSRLVRSLKPDIIQGWMHHGNLAAYLVKLSVPQSTSMVWNIRSGLDAIELLSKLTRILIHLEGNLSSSAHRIIYNSQRSRTQHEASGFFSKNGIVIPNGFDTEYWGPIIPPIFPMRNSFNLPPDAIVLGFVGRNHPQKDVANFLRSLTKVFAVEQNLYVFIIGRGIDRRDVLLRPLLESLPGERVLLLGERSDIPELMPEFDLFCLSSRTEGFPNVIGEAMSCGVPCISTDVGDAAMIIGDTGWVVPPSDSVAFAEAISAALALSKEERRKIGDMARQRVMDQYSIHSSVDQYKSLYEGLL